MVIYFLKMGETAYWWTNQKEGQRILDELLRDGALTQNTVNKISSTRGTGPSDLNSLSSYSRPLSELRHLC